MKFKTVWVGFLQALGVVLYTLLVAWVLKNANTWFGQQDKFLSPVAFLLTFVLSAAVVGSLVMGRSTLLYLNGMKREGVMLFVTTVAWLAVGVVVIFLALL
ncbi:MAG: hypothetical protein ACM3NH_02980 [Candidatus Saccharibacteria bacterium]